MEPRFLAKVMIKGRYFHFERIIKQYLQEDITSHLAKKQLL